MPLRSRRRLRLYWPYCYHYGWHHHGPYGPPPPSWMMDRPTPEEEVEDLKEHIEMLKEELKAAEAELKKLGKSE
jgi:hypothetical protein